MGKRLGHMIREFREKQGRTIEEAANWVCPPRAENPRAEQ